MVTKIMDRNRRTYMAIMMRCVKLVTQHVEVLRREEAICEGDESSTEVIARVDC